MNKLFYILLSTIVLTACKTTDGIVKSDAPVSAKDYPYIDAFHKGMQYKVQGRTEEAILELEKCLAIRQDDDAVYYALSKLELERGNPDVSANYIQKANEISPENIWYIEELAYMYYENQQFEQAAIEFGRLVEKEPRNIDWQYAYSEALLRNGQTKEALEVFKTMEAQVGKHPHFALQRYNVQIEAGNESAAEAILLEAKEEFPQDPGIIGTLVDHYYKTNQLANAEKFLIELADADPQNGRAQLALADLYQRRNEMDKAYEALKLAIESPNLDIDRKMNVLINIQEQSVEVPDEMFPIVETFVNMYPDSAKTHSIQGDYLLRAEKDKEALKSYMRALEIDNSLFPLWNQVMILQFEMKDHESLFTTTKACFELFPTSTTAYLLHGIAANETKNYQSAIDALVMGVEMVTSSDKDLKAEFYGQLGEAYFGTKEYDSSIKNFKKAMDLDGANAGIMNSYARSLALLNRELELASSLIDQVIEAFPEQDLLYDSKGLIEFQRGNYEDAAKHFSKAAELDATKGMYLEHLGDALAKQNKINDAVNYWKQAKVLGEESEVLRKKIADKKYYAPEL